MNDVSAPIGVFDSGLGGLTAVKELTKLLPNENIVYFGDTGRVPYGTKSEQTIISYARQDINFLLSKNIKYILAACGTVSVIMDSEAVSKAVSEIPFMGIVEAASEAAVKLSVNKNIGVIGTRAAIKSRAYERCIKRLCVEAKISSVACPLFVSLVEEGRFSDDDKAVRLIAREYLKELKSSGIDVLILGCTHFPLLHDVISETMGKKVKLIDGGKAAAFKIKNELTERGMLNPGNQKGTVEYYVSDVVEGFYENASIFMEGLDGSKVERTFIENF